MGAEPESTYITGYRPWTKMGPHRNSDNSVCIHGLILAPIFLLTQDRAEPVLLTLLHMIGH